MKQLKGFSVLAAGVAVQLILGGVYAWSTLSPPLREVYGLNALQTELIYGSMIAVFSLTMIFSGKLMKRWAPPVLVRLSALTFLVAYTLAWLSGGNFLLLFPALGILAGVAIGLGYIVPLSVSGAWFPQHKGLVTGVAVFGFGGGAILLANIGTVLLAGGTDILTLFLYIGIAGAVVLGLASFVLHWPDDLHNPVAERDPAQTVTEGPDIGKPLVHSWRYWRLALGMFTGTLGGLVIIGKTASLAGEWGFGPAQAALAVSILALGNAGGRIFWGWANDAKPGWTLVLSQGLNLLAILGLLLGGSGFWLFALLIFLVGFFFGGNLVLYAAHVDRVFGPGSLAAIYPFIFVLYGFAALVGPPLGGWIHDLTGSYTLVLLFAALFPLLGTLIVGLPWDRLARSKA